MNVLFFWFNLGCPVGISVGVGILSRELKEAGNRVKVIHLNEEMGYPYDESRIARDVREFDPQLFALSFGGNHINQARSLADFLNARFSRIKTICGGVQATLTPEEVISWPGVDFICRGEADGRFVEFVKALQDGEDYGSHDSFWVKDGGVIRKNPIGPLPDISGGSGLDFEAYDFDGIIRLNRGFAETIIGRGCPKRCTYCHNEAVLRLYRHEMRGGFKVSAYCRQRSVDDIISELLEFKRRYPHTKAIIFADDALVYDSQWNREFARRYRDEIGLPFVSNASVEQIDREMADLLKLAGCNMIKFGFECGSERIRNEILKKRVSTRKLFRAVRLLQERDINIRGYIMIGNPTETTEEMLQTFRMCADLKLDTTRVAVMYPYPGTAIHRFCEERGLLNEDITPPSYLTDSVLKWDARTHLFLKKCIAINHWIMNAHLDNPASREYRRLTDQALGMSRRQWESAGTLQWIREESDELDRRLRSEGIPHYHHPFRDRPDAAYLMKKRKSKIINVDV